MTVTEPHVVDRSLIDLDAAIEIPATHADRSVELYRRMSVIREFEQRVNKLFLQGRIPGTIHLSFGQEACAVGATASLERTDWATITHRGHGQALAKGVSARSMMAELFARDTGCCRGHGGSLHVGDITAGAVPAIAIVGAAVPITAGIAYAFRAQGGDRVAVCFLGDGAMGEGDTHEGLNLAGLWSLPVVYVCENNGYSVSTPVERQFRNPDFARLASWYGVSSTVVDGNDVLAVDRAVSSAVESARQGGGPSFVECLTYRQGGHKRDDPGTYRPQDEVDLWLGRDPIDRMRRALVAAGLEGRAAEQEAAATTEIDEAVQFADQSPPALLELT